MEIDVASIEAFSCQLTMPPYLAIQADRARGTPSVPDLMAEATGASTDKDVDRP